jgi:hypothetical protein
MASRFLRKTVRTLPSPLPSLADLRYVVERTCTYDLKRGWDALGVTVVKSVAPTFPDLLQQIQRTRDELANNLDPPLATDSVCGAVLFSGDAMSPAIRTSPRLVPRDGDDDADADARASRRAALLVRELYYPEHDDEELVAFRAIAAKPGWLFDPNLLSRLLLWYPWPRRAHVGDVVAFLDPAEADADAETDDGDPAVIVRRVAALEGDVMTSTTGAEDDFVVPADHAWVLRDCDDGVASASDARDSRAFGPLPLRRVIGRVVYSARSASDHGVVRNSAEATRVDVPILSAELGRGLETMLSLLEEAAEEGDARSR